VRTPRRRSGGKERGPCDGDMKQRKNVQVQRQVGGRRLHRIRGISAAGLLVQDGDKDGRVCVCVGGGWGHREARGVSVVRPRKACAHHVGDDVVSLVNEPCEDAGCIQATAVRLRGRRSMDVSMWQLARRTRMCVYLKDGAAAGEGEEEATGGRKCSIGRSLNNELARVRASRGWTAMWRGMDAPTVADVHH